MRIGLIILGSDRRELTFWLAGKPGVPERTFSSVGEGKFTPSISTQIDHYIRASTAVVRDRGNLLTGFSFSTTRLFNTAEAAQQFALDYDFSFPRNGTLLFSVPMTGSGGIIERYLPEAVVEPPAREVIGATVMLHYSVKGGAITGFKQLPTAPYTGSYSYQP